MWTRAKYPGRQRRESPQGTMSVKFEGDGFSWYFLPTDTSQPYVHGIVLWSDVPEEGNFRGTEAEAKRRAENAAGIF